jgi:hypothetical protein
MSSDKDFKKTDREGVSAFREAMSSATKELMEHRIRLVDQMMLNLADQMTELHADGELNIMYEIEWPVQSIRFKEQFKEDLTALLIAEGLTKASIDIDTYDSEVEITIDMDAGWE